MICTLGRVRESEHSIHLHLDSWNIHLKAEVSFWFVMILKPIFAKLKRPLEFGRISQVTKLHSICISLGMNKQMESCLMEWLKVENAILIQSIKSVNSRVWLNQFKELHSSQCDCQQEWKNSCITYTQLEICILQLDITNNLYHITDRWLLLQKKEHCYNRDICY